MGIFLNSGSGNLVCSPVMTQVYHLASLTLQYPPEDAYGGIVAIKDGRRSDYTKRHALGRNTVSMAPCHDSRTLMAPKKAPDAYFFESRGKCIPITLQ